MKYMPCPDLKTQMFRSQHLLCHYYSLISVPWGATYPGYIPCGALVKTSVPTACEWYDYIAPIKCQELIRQQGCCITQGNKPLATGVTLASHTTLSSLTAIAATSILTSPELPELLKINAERLTQAYTTMTQVLKELRIPYMPANMGPFLFARLAPYAKTWQDESRVMEACKAAGVSVSTGKSYHGPDAEKGWARLNFAIQPAKLEEALGRLRIGLKSSSEVTENGATDNPT